MNGKVAYVVKGFPRLSESFILNEVLWLSRMGLKLELFSVKAGEDLGPIPALPPVEYLPRVSSLSATSLWRWLIANVRPFASSQWYLLRRHPMRYLRALVFACGQAFEHRDRARGGLKKTFVKEFLQATFIARRLLEQRDFQHIHAHFCHGATTIAWIASMLTGLPFSFTAHAKDIYEQRQNPGALLRQKLEAARFAVTCTHTNLEHLRTLTPRGEHVHAVYHGLDLSLFTPSAIPRVQPKLLAVGRLVEKKGFLYLVEACGLLRDQGIDFQLDIVGEPGDQTEAITRLIESLRLSGHVRVCPPVPQHALAELYRSAVAFVLPCIVVESGDRDGIPNVMAEAMASGLPVVVTDISGIPEIVESEVNGILVPPRSSERLAAALRRVLGDTALRARLGAAARQRIEKVFDAAKTHRELARIFAGA
jgi:glycosyltransferase involved in cell wall biosynthesis